MGSEGSGIQGIVPVHPLNMEGSCLHPRKRVPEARLEFGISEAGQPSSEDACFGVS